MPQVGKKHFAYNSAGVQAAKRESAATGIPMSDGAQRSVTEYAGGGKVGYNSIGMYKEGGKVDVRDVVRASEKRSKAKTNKAKNKAFHEVGDAKKEIFPKGEKSVFYDKEGEGGEGKGKLIERRGIGVSVSGSTSQRNVDELKAYRKSKKGKKK